MLYHLILFVIVYLVSYKRNHRHEFDAFHDLMKEIKQYLFTQGYIDFFTAHSMFVQKHFVEHWEPLHWFRVHENEYKIFAVTPKHLVHTLIVRFNDSHQVVGHDIINIEPFDVHKDDLYSDVSLKTNGFFSK